MDKQLENRIKQAFENKKYKWRTVGGVASESNSSRELVHAYISSHGDELVRSSARNSEGEQLYTSRKNYREQTGIGFRLSSAMRNRGA